MASCNVAAETSERKFSFFFQINRQRPHEVEGLDLSTYVKLKNSNSSALAYANDLIKEQKLINYEDEEIEVLFKSSDGVDFVRIDSRPSRSDCISEVISGPSLGPSANSYSHSKGGSTCPVAKENLKTSLKVKLKPKIGKKSSVWKCFVRTATGGICKLCSADVKANGNTTNLTNHIVRHHPASQIESSKVNVTPESTPANIENSDEDPDDPEAMDTTTSGNQDQQKPRGPPSSQPRIDTVLTEMSSFQDKGLKANSVTSALAYMIAKDDLPLSLTEKQGFKFFIGVVAPLYKVPGRTKLTDILDRKYEVLSEMVKEKLNNVDYVTLTADVWTETMTTTSYLGVTLHFAEEDELSSVVLGVIELSERHTSEYLRETFASVCNNWNIPLDKITAVVTDNGANIVKAVKETFGDGRHVPCFAHSLNLVPTKVIAATDPMKAIIVKIKAIVTYFNHTTAADELRKAQRGEKMYCLVQDVATRWNSTFYMLERFLQLIDVVSTVLLKLPNSPAMLSASEVAVVRELIEILRPVENVSKELCGEKYVTSSKVIPIIYCLRKAIDEVETSSKIGDAFKSDLVLELDRRFRCIEVNSLFAIPTLLDPRFKRLHFSTALACSKAIEKVDKALKAGKQTHREREIVSAVKQSASGHSEQDGGVWKFHAKLLEQKKNYDTEALGSSGLDPALQHYLSKETEPLKSNPIKYWNERKENAPSLTSIAVKYLSVVATSVPCERLFSLAGNVATPNRNRLSGERLSRLLFLKSLPHADWHL